MTKLTFYEWLFVLKSRKIVLSAIEPIHKFKKAKEKLKNNPKFQFLLEVEHQN